MTILTRAFSASNNSNLTPILFAIVGGLACLLVVLLVVTWILKLVRGKKKKSTMLTNQLTEEELDKIIDTDFVESDEE